MDGRENAKAAMDFFYQKSLPGVNGPLKLKFADSQTQKQIRQTEIYTSKAKKGFENKGKSQLRYDESYEKSNETPQRRRLSHPTFPGQRSGPRKGAPQQNYIYKPSLFQLAHSEQPVSGYYTASASDQSQNQNTRYNVQRTCHNIATENKPNVIKSRKSSEPKNYESSQNDTTPFPYMVYPKAGESSNLYRYNMSPSFVYQRPTLFIPPRPYSSHAAYRPNMRTNPEHIPSQSQIMYPQLGHIPVQLHQPVSPYQQYPYNQSYAYPYYYNVHYPQGYHQEVYNYPNLQPEPLQRQDSGVDQSANDINDDQSLYK